MCVLSKAENAYQTENIKSTGESKNILKSQNQQKKHELNPNTWITQYRK